MKKSKNNRAMLTVHLLGICAFIFLATLLVTVRCVTSNALRQAKAYNRAIIENTARRFDLECDNVKSTARGFLSTWFNYSEFDKMQTELPMAYIYDKDLKNFKNEVLGSLYNFMISNPSMDFSAQFIVFPGIYPEYGDRYFAPFVSSDGSYSRDSGMEFDYDEFDLPNLFNKMNEGVWRLPLKQSPLKKFAAVSYYVPLQRENSEPFGIFGIHFGLQEMHTILEEFLPYGSDDSAFLLVDENYTPIITAGSQNLVSTAISVGETNVGDYKGPDFHIYKTSLQNLPWQMITICNSQAVFGPARHLIYQVLTITVAGFLLMLLCTIFITRSVLREQRARIAAESALELASEVQTQILKEPEASGKGFGLKAWIKPAWETGGDLYDYLIKRDRLIFIIGDVSGKGISAALFMTQVCSLFRSYAASCDDPREIVTSINAVLARNNTTNTFCTMIVGVMDVQSGKTLLCNAGHTNPVLVHEGKATKLEITPSLPVAVMEDYDYPVDSVGLSEGDSLFLYSDGLNEARDIRHNLFGEQRILDTLNREGISDFNGLLAEIHSFTGTEPQSDDITLLCVSRVM